MVAKRPSLTDESFLAHLFSPKKNALPTGLRARPVAQTKGRKVARVNAYNKMSAVKQEVLKRSGQRDAYLQGKATFVEARKKLRDVAVGKGVVKPVRRRGPKPPVKISRRDALDAMIAQHFVAALKRGETRQEVDPQGVFKRVPYIQENDLELLDRQTIIDRASDPQYIMTVNGHEFNPYWYH